MFMSNPCLWPWFRFAPEPVLGNLYEENILFFSFYNSFRFLACSVVEQYKVRNAATLLQQFKYAAKWLTADQRIVP
jgi:hypothetical protein